MWDPRNYQDTDYGLDADESFEPVDADRPDPVDLSQPFAMTVLGPVQVEDLGACLVHEHILCNPVAVTGKHPEYRLERPDLAAQELEAFFTAGGRAMVDASTRDYGRDVPGLRVLAQRVPVHLITVTGRHHHLHASTLDHADDHAHIEDEILGELRDGVGDTGIWPGAITFGTSLDEMTSVEQAAGRAAASAAAQTGWPITTHTEAGTMAHAQLDLVERWGVSPERVIVGHLDCLLDPDYLIGIARRGAWISFDQIGKARYGPDEPKAQMVMRLAEAGFGDQILLSQDLARTSDFIAHGGGPGWIHLLERFTLELMAAGAEAGMVRALLVDNPARALAIHAPAQALT